MQISWPMPAWPSAIALGSRSNIKSPAVHTQVSEAALRSVLSPAGFVWELKVPRNSDGTPSPIPCLAGRLEDSVLVTLFIGSLALPLHGDLVWYMLLRG